MTDRTESTMCDNCIDQTDCARLGCARALFGGEAPEIIRTSEDETYTWASAMTTDKQIRYLSAAYCRRPFNQVWDSRPCDDPCDSCRQKAEQTLNRMPWWTPAGLLLQDMEIDYLGITREIVVEGTVTDD